MEELWVNGSGSWSETELQSKAKAVLPNPSADETRCFMALYTDKFICASIDKLDAALADVAWLLELRVFDRVRELWAHRSMLGEPFSWRIADDKALEEEAKKQQEPFFNNPESYRIESTQRLDIDNSKEHKPTGEPQYGGTLLRSTGRSVYELPINDENAIKLVSYIRYDDSGIANVVDYRLKAFCKLEVADDKKGGERQ